MSDENTAVADMRLPTVMASKETSYASTFEKEKPGNVFYFS